MSALTMETRWAGGSRVSPEALLLAAEAGRPRAPSLDARLVAPRRLAPLLLALGDVVHARHHVPPAMLSRILAEADPVVTVGGGTLRFEGFSACCSAYARVDVLPGGLDSARATHGTTNVDFSAALRAALQGLRFDDRARVLLTADALHLEHGDARLVERRIRLPLRWLRGFLQVAQRLRQLTPAREVPAALARRWIQELPRDPAFKVPTWLVPSGAGMRLSTRPAPGGVRLSGPSRVRALEPALRDADHLAIWADPEDQASAWVVQAGDARLTLLLSADPWRGLSGEGQGLLDVARPPDGLDVARARLGWQAVLTEAELGGAAMVGALAAQGHLGFDLDARAWFHRELPWRPERLDALLPRLRAAQETAADADAVRFEGAVAWVRGSQGEHRVDLAADPPACSCTWRARTGGRQGPCRHVLAAQLRQAPAPG